MKQKKRSSQFGMMLLFTCIVFVSLLVNSLISCTVVYFFVRAGILSVSSHAVPHIGNLIVTTALVTVPVGILTAVIVSKFPLKPIRNLISSMDRLASGDFKTRVNLGFFMRHYPSFVEIADSFNKMAQELESTEMLRSDFINNFSHEFKTPIVSIAGFAKLLQRGNLPQEQQKEYLNAIEEESLRLSYMATNVLNLTKLENQQILRDVSCYNLSEQIRSCILLLENKWDQKRLDLQLEFGEHMIYANEELLKQVWINLLDNAIKFAPEGHTVRVQVAQQGDELAVTIANTGSFIAPEDQEKVFLKFYQADQSHATQGNGVGLAIVKRITELHGGQVQLKSEEDVTAFTVCLPQ